MDGTRFDTFARLFASRRSRRGVLASAATVVAGAIGLRGRTAAQVTGSVVDRVPCVDFLFGSGSATGGHHITLRVSLSAPAPTGGAKIAMGSSNAAITPPATVTVPAGATDYSFTAATHPVPADTAVVVSASTGTCKVSRSVTVKAPVLRALHVQTVIRSGGRGKITVCLTGETASGGIAVALNSNRPSILPVPSSIVIPAGRACLSIVANAANVRSDVSVTIRAREGGTLYQPTVVRNFDTATPTPTNTPTGTPIDSPTNTPTTTPTNTPADTATALPTDTATPIAPEPPTATPTILTCASGGPCTVFVTSTVFGGNLGGLAGGDAACQVRASAAGLPGTFRAWLSTDTTHAASRFVHSTGPYRLVTGAIIANDWNDLTDATLATPIDRTENGIQVSSPVWTGTDASGQSTGMTCVDWTTSSSASVSRVGATAATDAGWTSAGIDGCANSHHLYCVQVS